MGNVRVHNSEMRNQAEYRAREMRTWPSPLEEKMIAFLEEHGIDYHFQKIFYITADDGWIIRYYIADFYLEDCNVIIEMDGKFHNKHKQADRDRTKAIEEVCPGVEVLRFRWKDMSDASKMRRLLAIIS